MPCHDESKSKEPATRVRYFFGQLLSADDFETEQRYLIGKRQLHNRALHGPGVVTGLEVATDGSDVVVVSPGIALDGCGREIVVPAQARSRLTAGTAEIVLRYREDAAGVTPEGEPSRIVEGYELTAEPPGSTGSEHVVLGVVERTLGKLVVRARHRRRAPKVRELLQVIDELRERLASLEAQVAALRGDDGP